MAFADRPGVRSPNPDIGLADLRKNDPELLAHAEPVCSPAQAFALSVGVSHCLPLYGDVPPIAWASELCPPLVLNLDDEGIEYRGPWTTVEARLRGRCRGSVAG